MKKISIKFVDSPRDFKWQEHFYGKVLLSNFEVIEEDVPQYLFSLGYGTEFQNARYDSAIKIAITSENIVPDFTFFDYVVAFDYINFGDRYYRMPIWARWRGAELLEKGEFPSDDELVNREFCSFVISNGHCADPVRTEFYEELSKYKPIASGGRYMNNIGHPVEDKLAFCRRYKFNIAFENSVVPGYTTEKLMESLAACSIPIYYGDPLVTRDFNANCMVHLTSRNQIKCAIEQIVALDHDDAAYLKMCKANRFVGTKPVEYRVGFERFIVDVLSRDVDVARRISLYGWQPLHRKLLYVFPQKENLMVRLSRKFRQGVCRVIH